MHRNMSRPIQAVPLLAAQLADYQQRWPDETATVQAFLDLLQDAQDPFLRERLAGHFTSGAWLVSADGTRILMTHHRKLERWLQLGGHADGDRDMGRVALKEAQEESGLPGLSVDGDMANVALKEAQEESGLPGLSVDGDTIFDLDRHWIPERKDVPGHWHYDVRYVVRAGEDENYVVSEESHDLAWRLISDVAQDADESMSRMARKWLARP